MRILIVSIFFIIPCVLLNAADLDKAKSFAPAFNYMEEASDVLDEGDDIKKLILKYNEAAPAQKPAIKKEIEKLETQKEDARIKKHDERIKRQEEKIKDLKAASQERKKNIKQNVSKKVDYLISDESVEKIKNESASKKAIDKVKDKRK